MNWIDALGYVASASVLATFCMSTMISLRVVAISSNVLFAAYGALVHIYPVLTLHIILLPVNLARLVQTLNLIKNAKVTQLSDPLA
jgi:CRP/FNR family transcriptional regulator, cyclic AMP receptor protein